YYKASDIEKAEDGRYIAKEGVNSVPTDQIVISAVNPDGSTTEATKLANVASSIGGEVKSDSNSFIDNLNKVGATGDGSVNPNTAVTAQDLKNLADTGFKLQTNDNGVNTVKAGNTVQVKDGINTKVSKVEEKAGVFSYSINVNGVPMTYVNKEGKALAKVGDQFFLLKDNGELDLEGSTPENTKIAGVALVDPQGGSEAQTLDNIKNGELKADSKQAVNGGQIANILGTDAEGKAITTNIGGTGKDNIDSAIKAVKTASVSEVTAGDNVEINTVESDSGKKVSISTSMNPNFDTVGLGAIRDQDGKLQPRISLGVTKDGALAVAGADGKSPVRITNVADPVQDSDAVNKRYVDMNNRKLRGGIAGAIATASLPQAYTSGKSLFAVSGGTYGGQSAVALGVSRISDNGKMIIKLVGSTNTQGSVSGGVGVGFEW
ncbi:YadA-like family protein, partial [Gallibacterium anatis]|uniref:YadA-like family protein n=1 Tax=Gallibacterium anatis TaxID=750 RepID=UPI000A4FCE43